MVIELGEGGVAINLKYVIRISKLYDGVKHDRYDVVTIKDVIGVSEPIYNRDKMIAEWKKCINVSTIDDITSL